MLVKFKSKAAPDLLMLDRHAQKVLALFGKNVAAGCFTVSELDNAIDVLETMTADTKRHAATQALAQDVKLRSAAAGDTRFHEAQEPVDFATHLFPLLEMMRAARSATSFVAWNI